MAAGPLPPRALGGGTDRNDALQRAMLALNGQRPQEAQRLAEEILKTDQRHPQALHILGWALLIQGRAQDAIAPLETAARGRHDPAIETKLALALRQVGRQEDALWRLKRATKRQPPYPAAFHDLGSLLSAMERYDEAIEILRRGREAAPMMPEMSIQLGHALLRRRNYSEAKAAFAQALAIAAGSYDALFGLAKAHYETGEIAAAADYFRRCLTIRSDDYATWLHLGHCLLELGQRDAGYECFRTAARGDARRYGAALASLAASGRGRAWLRPSAAARFLRGTKN